MPKSKYKDLINGLLNLISPEGPSAAANPAPQVPMKLPQLTPEMQSLRNADESLVNGDFEGARTHWQNTLGINPNNIEARRGLERIAMNAGKNIDAYKPRRRQ